MSTSTLPHAKHVAGFPRSAAMEALTTTSRATSKIDTKQSIFKNSLQLFYTPLCHGSLQSAMFSLRAASAKKRGCQECHMLSTSTDGRMLRKPPHLSFSACFARVASTSSLTRSIDLKYLTVLTCSSVPSIINTPRSAHSSVSK